MYIQPCSSNEVRKMFKISKPIQQRVAREMWPQTANQVRFSFVVSGKSHSLSEQLVGVHEHLNSFGQHIGVSHEQVAQADQPNMLVADASLVTSSYLLGGAT
jgi:hypothetical protein